MTKHASSVDNPNKGDDSTAVPSSWPDQELRDECAELLNMLYAEVGKKWMSFALKCQIEKIEELLQAGPE
jgi:hypothetical protein